MGDRTCAEPGCEETRRCRGYCGPHYHRHKRAGRIKNLPPVGSAERFWMKVEKNGPLPKARPELGPCWIFSPDRKLLGYGHLKFGESQVPAHRISYALSVGPIPDGLVIDHLCSTPACVHPGHLEAVPQKTNIERGRLAEAIRPYYERGRFITHCPQGHEFTEENSYFSPKGYRSCRTCKRIDDLRRWQSNPEHRARNTENARRRRERLRAAKLAAQSAA